MGLSLTALYEAALGQSAARGAAAGNEIGNVNSITGEMVNIMQRQADASKQVGEAEVAAIEAKGARELAADAERKRMEAAMVGPHGASDLVDFMGQQSVKIAMQKTQLDQERAAIVGKMQVGFADDPLQWIANAFTVPEEVRAYNAKYAGLKGEMEFQAQVDQALRGGLMTQKQLEATTSAQETNAAAVKARNMATVVALSSQYKAMEASLTAVQLRTSLLNVKADAARDALSMGLSMAANARAEEAAQEARAARAEKKLGEDELAKVLPAAFAAHGLEAERGTVNNWKKLAQVDKDAAESILKFAYKLDYAKGSSKPDAIAGVRIAEEPVDAYALVQKGLPLQGNGAQAAWLKKVDEKTQAVLRGQRFDGNKDFLALPKAQQAEVYRKTYNEMAKREANPNADNMKVSAGEFASLKVGGESLAAVAPGIAKLIGANPALKNSQLTPEEVVKTVRAAVFIEGGFTDINKRAANVQRYAKELEYLYTAKMQANFLGVQPHLVGAAASPTGEYEYAITQGQLGNFLPKTQKIRITRSADWARILLKESINGQ